MKKNKSWQRGYSFQLFHRRLFFCVCIIIFFKDLCIRMLLIIVVQPRRFWYITYTHTVVYSHYAQLRAKHQQHVCVQTETKPARSNQTFAAVSLSHDNDSVNSYDAGSRYLGSSLLALFLQFLTRSYISEKKLPHTFLQFLIICEMIFYIFLLIIKNKIYVIAMELII